MNIKCTRCKINDAHSGYIRDNPEKDQVWYCDDCFPGGSLKRYQHLFDKVPIMMIPPCYTDVLHNPLPDEEIEPYWRYGVKGAFDGINPELYDQILNRIELHKKHMNMVAKVGEHES